MKTTFYFQNLMIPVGQTSRQDKKIWITLLMSAPSINNLYLDMGKKLQNETCIHCYAASNPATAS